MFYFTVTGKATPGREEEAVRWLKKLALYNEQNYSRTVEILAPLAGPNHVYIFVIKVESLAVWEADHKRWATDAQAHALYGEREELFVDFTSHILETL